VNLLPNPWFLLAFVLAVGGAYVLGQDQGDDAGSARIQQAWDNAQRVAADNRAKRIENNRQKEQALQADADQQRNNDHALLQKRNADLRAARYELRNRPARPSGPGTSELPQAAGAGPKSGGATGAELYRDDAEFLTGKADLAQRIRDQRDTCYRRYEAAQKVMGTAQ
jgi:hypothetical protein